MQISRILLGADILEEWFGQVRQFALECPGERDRHSQATSSSKDSRRKFNGDEDELVSEFGLLYGIAEDELRPRKLATITEIERKLAARVKDKDELAEGERSLLAQIHDQGKARACVSPLPATKRPAVNAVATDYASVKLPAA